MSDPVPLLPRPPGGDRDADSLAEFTLRVRVLPGEVPRAARVRRWLKLGLRYFGIVNAGFVDDLPEEKGDST
jgi:hypothetical protein